MSRARIHSQPYFRSNRSQRLLPEMVTFALQGTGRADLSLNSNKPTLLTVVEPDDGGSVAFHSSFHLSLLSLIVSLIYKHAAHSTFSHQPNTQVVHSTHAAHSTLSHQTEHARPSLPASRSFNVQSSTEHAHPSLHASRSFKRPFHHQSNIQTHSHRAGASSLIESLLVFCSRLISANNLAFEVIRLFAASMLCLLLVAACMSFSAPSRILLSCSINDSTSISAA